MHELATTERLLSPILANCEENHSLFRAAEEKGC
jgi:hypothetical protein